jgi:hypothetical protein
VQDFRFKICFHKLSLYRYSEEQIRAMRAAAVASKFKRSVVKSKDMAQERKVVAQGRWSSLGGAGLGSKMRAAAAGGGGDGRTPSPPQRWGCTS